MFYYHFREKLIFSQEPVYCKNQDEWLEIDAVEAAALNSKKDIVYYIDYREIETSFRSSCLSEAHLSYPHKKDINFYFKAHGSSADLPDWLRNKIIDNKVMHINKNHPTWMDALILNYPKKWRIHVAGLGDVGGTLVSGLRLMGGSDISTVGIFDLDQNKLLRWEYEANQIFADGQSFPKVEIISEAELFDCDIFAFCVTVGVPPLDHSLSDVRIAQFEGNSKIVSLYAQKARDAGYKGIFAVVSDPVDLLCKTAFMESNKDENGLFDYLGLAAEQIRGYGLGVMHARAVYHSEKHPECIHYLSEGRAYGPHGDGLIIADSVTHYNHEHSLFLTEKAQHSNLDVRATGFKPYIAPAFSSGTLSLIATIRGQWHYSAVFIDGIYLGCRNRLLPAGTEIERLDLPHLLFERVQYTYNKLKSMV